MLGVQYVLYPLHEELKGVRSDAFGVHFMLAGLAELWLAGGSPRRLR